MHLISLISIQPLHLFWNVGEMRHCSQGCVTNATECRMGPVDGKLGSDWFGVATVRRLSVY